jgi:Flp pilus assembly pilin Flp
MLKDYLAAKFGRMSDDEGQGMVEYALIIGVISIILIATFLSTGIATEVSNLSNYIINGIKSSGFNVWT